MCLATAQVTFVAPEPSLKLEVSTGIYNGAVKVVPWLAMDGKNENL